MESTPGDGLRGLRSISRKYQLELCQKAVEQNTVVYLGTGCGKTHIALLLMYELAHLFRKPKKDVCVFLAPTVPLVLQQALVVENSTDFKVQAYCGSSTHLKIHDDWEKEMKTYEVLVMTPQILLHSLRHCFIRLEMVVLLIFDECHHAQIQSRHPYAQIMKEFYRISTNKARPRVFGMTASPIFGKGGFNRPEFAKHLNSLEHLLDAKVCVVEDDAELESVLPSSETKVYYYNRVALSSVSKIVSCFLEELEKLKKHFMFVEREKHSDFESRKKQTKLLFRVHNNLIFCLENVGIWGAIQAARILLASNGAELMERQTNIRSNHRILQEYLKGSISIFSCKLLENVLADDELPLGVLEEPLFSRKLLVLIKILLKYKDKPATRCIIFVKRIVTAKSLAHILRNLKCLDFWRCDFLVGFHSGSMSRDAMNRVVDKFSSGELNLLIATNVAEEGLDIRTCSLVIRFDLPETVASFIQSRGRARMLKSEYAFIVEMGNKSEEGLLAKFIQCEDAMNKEVMRRTSDELFDYDEELSYRVDATGASISTASSVSLLHHYCSKLPHKGDIKPMPRFYYIDDLKGYVCRVVLPSNSPVGQVDSDPSSSRDKAKRSACLKACIELHTQGALSNYLLPNLDIHMKSSQGESHNECADIVDPTSKEELHEMLIPSILTVPWNTLGDAQVVHFYFIKFIPVPEDREYRKFGLFVTSPLPEEAENIKVDLHLSFGRTVKTALVPLGMTKFTPEDFVLAANFQEMSLKVIFDRSEFMVDFVALGKDRLSSLTTSYLFLPIVQHHACGNDMIVDWDLVRNCLSSPVFYEVKISDYSTRNADETLKLFDGPVHLKDVLNSLIFVPTSGTFYIIDGILTDITGYSTMTTRKLSYCEYYQTKFGITLLQPEQPLLKAKQLCRVRNLLCNRIQGHIEARELKEYFVELPPEVCQVKIVGFSKDIVSSLSLLPSFMHRLQNLLVALELKGVLSTSFPGGSEVTSFSILQALTTEKCLERFSLERLEILGDAFLKYAVGRHIFLSRDALNEGQLTNMRSSDLNNANLYDLAIRKRLQIYIRNEKFDPENFFAIGRPCKVICNHETQAIVESGPQLGMLDQSEIKLPMCNKFHHLLRKKTIADVVESLVGAFLVDSGFKAATAFLKWLGITTDYEFVDIQNIWKESEKNLSLINTVNIASLEKKLGYRFQHKGLLIEAFIHPSYTKSGGRCYQRLEFLGDAVIDYLIMSYVFTSYPVLKPGQLSDLRSIIVSNASFARIAVHHSFHKHLIEKSDDMRQEINKFARYISMIDEEDVILDKPAIPKVLGDIVESCIGAILVDSGFDMNCVWKVMLNLFNPVLKYYDFQISSIRELLELCQLYGFQLKFPQPIKNGNAYLVAVNVEVKGRTISCCTTHRNTRTAKKLAAKKIISKLKGLGYRHKSKSLEDVLLTTRIEKPMLIGFDEEPVVQDVISMAELEVQEEEKLVLSGLDEETALVKNAINQFGNVQDEEDLKNTSFPEAMDISLSNEASPTMEHGDDFSERAVVVASAKSRLFAICSANYWNPPTFTCFKEEGLSHLKMFTSKVTVQVEGSADAAIIECFSEPRPKIKAAQEHAAEGAIWYLTKQGLA